MGDDERTEPMVFPDFTVPEGSGIPKTPVEPVKLVEGTGGPASPAGTPPAAPTPAAGTTPPAVPASPAEEMFPKHRYDELHTRNQQLQGQIDRLTGLLTSISNVFPSLRGPAAPAAPAEPIDPERQKDIDTLKRLIPFWDGAESLVSMKARIEAALTDLEELKTERVQSSKQQQAGWDRYAVDSLKAVHMAIAPFYLPSGKSVTDLPEFRKQTITDLFIRWIGADNARAQRYDEHDTGLVAEFKQFFEEEMVSPFKRDAAAKLVVQAKKVAALPVGGQTSSTLGTPPPHPKPVEGEDAMEEALKRGWAHHQAQVAQG